MPPLPGIKVLIGHGVRKSTTSDRAGKAQKATVRLSMKDRKTGKFFLEMGKQCPVLNRLSPTHWVSTLEHV